MVRPNLRPEPALECEKRGSHASGERLCQNKGVKQGSDFHAMITQEM